MIILFKYFRLGCIRYCRLWSLRTMDFSVNTAEVTLSRKIFQKRLLGIFIVVMTEINYFVHSVRIGLLMQSVIVQLASKREKRKLPSAEQRFQKSIPRKHELRIS